MSRIINPVSFDTSESPVVLDSRSYPNAPEPEDFIHPYGAVQTESPFTDDPIGGADSTGSADDSTVEPSNETLAAETPEPDETAVERVPEPDIAPPTPGMP